MGVFGIKSIGFLRLNVGVTLPLPFAVFSSLDEGVVATARPKDGVRIPPLRGREVDGAWFPDGVTGRDPGATGKGIINPSESLIEETSTLSEGVALTGDDVANGRDPVCDALFGNEETRSLVKVDNFAGLGSAGRSAKGMRGIDESASSGVTLVFSLVVDGAGVGSPEADEECI